MQKTKVVLLFGGQSSEHEVSISSVRNIYAAMDDSKYEVLLCYIDKQGKWWLIDELSTSIDTHGASQLVPVLGTGSFLSLPQNQVIRPDVIFPVLHGKNGEDGSVQGLAQLLPIPIVGCDMPASTLCMDKLATKQLLSANNIDVVPFQVHRTGSELPNFSQLSMHLGMPIFVKPARSGSSVGVSKVFSEEELIQALDLAHEHDSVALIEQGITGRELEVAVIGNPPNHQASGVGEIIPGEDFYSYDAKYSTASQTQVEVPADMHQDVADWVIDQAKIIYALLGCRGLARIDFFLSEDGVLYLNEVNTMPGFTNISMYPKLWQAAGTSYAELVERLINLAVSPES